MMPAQETESVEQDLKSLRLNVISCRACHIAAEANFKPTHSSGKPSKVVFVGRNPGIQERDQRRPFVGKTKADVDAMIDALGYDRDTAYITNLVKCYTSNPKPDRPPTADEIRFCASLHLDREIALLAPEVVVTFGKDAFLYMAAGFFPYFSGMNGRVLPLPGKQYVLFPMFHPAMMLYDKPKYKTIMEQDFGQLFLYLKAKHLLGPRLRDENI